MSAMQYRSSASSVYRRLRDIWAEQIRDLDPDKPKDRKKILKLDKKLQPIL